MHRRLALAALLCAFILSAQPSQPPLPEAQRTQWFRDAKFGIFIHWGVYSAIGRDEWARNIFHIPQAEYDTYIPQFNPVNFDPFAWVDLAQNAGARYMIITSKHHDGFSIFRGQVSNYDMKLTPYPGDPLKMLSDAARAKGMRLGFYHSIMDWHHPDYRPTRDWESSDPKAGGNLPRYIDYMEAELKELLTRYGDVAAIWFDGEWEHTPEEIRADEVYDMIRKLQPNTLINDRLYNRKGGKGDYGTPEQFVPATGIKDANGRAALWESCVTINSSSWGYNKYETRFKTNRDLIRMLIEVVSKGGNLLLNIGPRPDGTIQPEFVSRLQAMGAWMKVNNEAIYGTTASPFTTLPFFGRATQKGNTLYLHVFEWPLDGKLRVPALQNQVLAARLLADPSTPLPTLRVGKDVLVSLPFKAPDEIASVVALDLDSPARAGQYRIGPDASGTLTLGSESSEIETRFEQRAKLENALHHVFLTSWSKPQDIPYWNITVPEAGSYNVSVSYAATKNSNGADFTIKSASTNLPGKVSKTDGEWVFNHQDVGQLTLPAGPSTVKIEIADRNGQDVMQLEKIVLAKAH
jgi:alpha-L-fucosidase